MAAVSKTLTTHIQDLINSIGERDRPAIRAKLVRFLRLAEALENGAAARKAKSKIARLETALKTSEADRERANAALEQSSAEIANLQIELQTMQAEVAKYQQERARQKEREIDPIQFQILNLLPSPSGTNWLSSYEIARTLKIPLDEADAYINGLEKLGFVIFQHHEPGGGGWRRTTSGNTLVLAKRRAGEEEEPSADKNLGENAQKTLILIAREDGLDETAIAERMEIRLSVIRRILHLLQDAGLATDAEKPGEGISSSERPEGRIWYLLRKGEDYLAERSLL